MANFENKMFKIYTKENTPIVFNCLCKNYKINPNKIKAIALDLQSKTFFISKDRLKSQRVWEKIKEEE